MPYLLEATFHKSLAGIDGCFACGNNSQKMRVCPNVKARRKEVNKASLDPNAPKKNPSYGIVAWKDN